MFVSNPSARRRSLLVLGLGLLAWGCGGGDDDGSSPGATAGSAVLVGQVDPQVLSATNGLVAKQQRERPNLVIQVNQVDREVPLGEDLSFAIRELPTGDVTLSVEVEGIRGVIELQDVVDGEVIEIRITGGDGALAIQVERRDRPLDDSPAIDPPPEGPLVIRGNGGAHHFGPGVFRGDVEVRGNGVRLVGACGDPTVIDGDLIVRGNGVRVLDIEVLGRTDVRGNGFRAISTGCVGGFDDDLDDDVDEDFDEDADEDFDEEDGPG